MRFSGEREKGRGRPTFIPQQCHCEMKRMNSENSENSENAMRRVKYSVLATIILGRMEKNKENKEVRTSKVKTDFYNLLYLNL